MKDRLLCIDNRKAYFYRTCKVGVFFNIIHNLDEKVNIEYNTGEKIEKEIKISIDTEKSLW